MLNWFVNIGQMDKLQIDDCMLLIFLNNEIVIDVQNNLTHFDQFFNILIKSLFVVYDAFTID